LRILTGNMGSRPELQSRRRTLGAELAQIEQERQQVARTQQQTIHWGQVINHAEMFRQLLGTNLELLSFEERQAVVQCLISKVVVTGVQVDIYYVLPFVSAPQLGSGPTSMPEGTSGLFCRLRLAERPLSASRHPCRPMWSGSRRRNSPNMRLVPQPPNPDLRRVSLSGDTPDHEIQWSVYISSCWAIIYADHQPLIAAYALASPPGVARTVTCILATVKRDFANVHSRGTV